MVSRRKILSRSRDDLNLEHQYQQQDDEEDIWYQKDKLYKVSSSSALFMHSIVMLFFNRHTKKQKQSFDWLHSFLFSTNANQTEKKQRNREKK